jgi:hypothetical protein
LMMPSDLVLSNMVWKRSLFFISYLCSDRLASEAGDVDNDFIDFFA